MAAPSPRFASDQPTGYVNQVTKVAIIGAGGQLGKFITAELLKNKDLTVTALTRPESTNKIAEGVRTAHIDYDKPDTIVDALRGQEYLIVTLPQTADKTVQRRIVDAAVKAGVHFYTPNEWGFDGPSAKFNELSLVGATKAEEREYARKAGLPFIGVANGFWYEFSLAFGIDAFGIDVPGKKARFIDDGAVRISVSTWEQIGRAVAALVALPILPQDANDKRSTLSKYVNGFVRIQSFVLSQREILDAVQKETDTTDADWSISSRPHAEAHQEGLDRLAKGDIAGFIAALYATGFFPQEEANFIKRGVLNNDDLGLPQENLSDATKRAVALAKGA